MKKLLYLAFIPALLIAAVSCQKDNPKTKAFLYRQWEMLDQSGVSTSAILDISKKQLIWKNCSHDALALPELMYDNSHIFPISKIAKRHTQQEGDVWEIKDIYGNSYFIFDVTEESAKYVPYDLEISRDDWLLLRPVNPSVKLTYHYVPASAVDLGLSVYWARFDMRDEFPENFDPETDYFDNYVYDSEKDDYVYSIGGFYDNSLKDGQPKDPVHDKFGGHWRMPTKAEWEELLAGMDWVYFTPEDNEDFPYWHLDGCGKKPGYDWEYISFTLNGYYNKSTLHNHYIGYYWAASEGTEALTPCAQLSDAETQEVKDFLRPLKCNIRPVWDPNL